MKNVLVVAVLTLLFLPLAAESAEAALKRMDGRVLPTSNVPELKAIMKPIHGPEKQERNLHDEIPLEERIGQAEPEVQVSSLRIDSKQKVAAELVKETVLETVITKASWYGYPFHGRTTASGARYDMYGLTAAHLRYPFGTRVLVTNLNNNKQVIVTITDDGPHIAGRGIDLSKKAMETIGGLGSGVVSVKLEVLSWGWGKWRR